MGSEAFSRLAQIMGCKWSMGILDAVERGVARPTQIERELHGISTRVLYRCMDRLQKEGFLLKESFDEIPPRVEYRFSDDGRVLMELIQHARLLGDRWHDLRPMELD